ncbi:MAG: nickel-responsive transcriptional regulator NikR [Chitinispirillaceae bacterium]|nr:nickel-responsive transcriptional regulator NikR [Chitinispirillaceae bacterium]
MEQCIRFGVSLPPKLLEDFDKEINRRGYSNRSEAIRDLIRNELVKKEWENISGETAAAVILVYDHHQRGLTEKLTEKQHEYYEYIISTMHSHLDHDNCIEVILLRGKAEIVRNIAENLVSQKHVKLGKFVPATLGKRIC